MTGALVAVTDAVRQGGMDPLGLVVLAAVTVALGFLVAMMNSIHEQSEERRRLITELEATRGELAASERRAGALAERQRLAGEIHDTLAQGFASIVTLYEAAYASWSPTITPLSGAGSQACSNPTLGSTSSRKRRPVPKR